MKEIEFLKHLIADAESESSYIELYHKEEALAEESGSWKEFWKMRTPSRQRIKDDLKMARRITIDIERRLDDE